MKRPSVPCNADVDQQNKECKDKELYGHRKPPSDVFYDQYCNEQTYNIHHRPARHSSNTLCRINNVTLWRAWLVLGWVTVYEQVNHLGTKQAC